MVGYSQGSAQWGWGIPWGRNQKTIELDIGITLYQGTIGWDYKDLWMPHRNHTISQPHPPLLRTYNHDKL
jgi:hypothetical protein